MIMLIFYILMVCIPSVTSAMDHPQVKIDNVTLHVVQADLLSMDVEVIVDPANTQLDPAGGVSKLINDKWLKDNRPVRGPELQVGDTSIVSEMPPIFYFSTPIRYIIHAVGPNFKDKQQQTNGLEILKMVYYHALKKAQFLTRQDHSNIRTIAFPIISGEIFRGNQSQSSIAQAALKGIKYWIDMNSKTSDITDIYLVTYAPNNQISPYFTLLKNDPIFNKKSSVIVSPSSNNDIKINSITFPINQQPHNNSDLSRTLNALTQNFKNLAISFDNK